MDEADTRRGVESVNARWGNLQAILAGDFLLARASEIAASLGTEVAALLARTIGRLCEGQIAELRRAFDAPPGPRPIPRLDRGQDGVAVRGRLPHRRHRRRAAPRADRRPHRLRPRLRHGLPDRRRRARPDRHRGRARQAGRPRPGRGRVHAAGHPHAGRRRCGRRRAGRPARAARSDGAECRQGARHRALERRRGRGGGGRPGATPATGRARPATTCRRRRRPRDALAGGAASTCSAAPAG